jgi:hypothetical protein
MRTQRCQLKASAKTRPARSALCAY